MRTGPGTRIGQISLFVALLAGPLVYQRIVLAGRLAPSDSKQSVARYGVQFTESARASGINFVHKAPTLDPKLGHIMEQVASMGAAVSIVDFDRDGWQDIFVIDSSERGRNALFRNLGDG